MEWRRAVPLQETALQKGVTEQGRLRFREPRLDIVVVDDLFLEGVRARLRAAHHLNDFRVLLSTSGLQRSNGLLCHGLFDLLVDGVLAQDRIELLDFHPLRRVLPVLRGHVARGARHARILVLGALQNDLYAVAFFGHDSFN